jgi:hypothetical protein
MCEIATRHARLWRNLYFCHSVQAKRDTESSILNNFWMPVFTGMTVFMELSAIMTQSRRNAVVTLSGCCFYSFIIWRCARGGLFFGDVFCRLCGLL